MQLRRKLELLRLFGLLGGMRIWMDARVLPTRETEGPAYKVLPRGLKFPVSVRRWTSDQLVLKEVFFDRVYDHYKPAVAPKLIIDCGAYVGYSCVYFLDRFPHAKVIAVEPDAANAESCRKNVAPYGDRCKVIHAAVWGHPGKLSLERRTLRDGLDWATSVRESKPGEHGDVDAVDIVSLAGPEGSIDLLKVDIEGSEVRVFGASSAAWLPRVREIIIELHDEECKMSFFKAIGPFDFKTELVGDLTYATTRREA